MEKVNGLSFPRWMERLNALFRARFGGMVADDFEDWCWSSYWREGCTAQQAFDTWLSEVWSDYHARLAD
jgi:hypothetical protein